MDPTRALEKHERGAFFNRDPDSESEKSEGEIPYVDFDDFDDQIAERLRFNKKWSQEQKYYEWNRLVIDKA